MALKDPSLTEEVLTRQIIGAFFYVYNTFHHGFLETIYARALEQVLTRSGHVVDREVRVPVWFEGNLIGYQRLDMLVDKKVVVEIKATERLPDHAERQLRSYLKAIRLDVGLILHFGVKAGVHRISQKSARERRASVVDPNDPSDPSDPLH